MKQSQNEKILHYIKEHGSITPREAFTEIGCMRLAARISDLKKQGHRIKTERKTVLARDGTTTVAAYSIEEE